MSDVMTNVVPSVPKSLLQRIKRLALAQEYQAAEVGYREWDNGIPYIKSPVEEAV